MIDVDFNYEVVDETSVDSDTTKYHFFL